MKRRVHSYMMIILALGLFVGACSKYDDGPWFSLYGKEKRVQGRWYFSTVKYNDVDSSSVYKEDPIQTVEFYLATDKDAIWKPYTWNKGFGISATVDYGVWTLTDDMDSLKMINTLSVKPNGEVETDSVEYFWKINRLAYTEFWLDRQANDSTQVKWKLWKLSY